MQHTLRSIFFQFRLFCTLKAEKNQTKEKLTTSSNIGSCLLQDEEDDAAPVIKRLAKMASIFIAALYYDVLTSLNTYVSMGDPCGIPPLFLPAMSRTMYVYRRRKQPSRQPTRTPSKSVLPEVKTTVRRTTSNASNTSTTSNER